MNWVNGTFYKNVKDVPLDTLHTRQLLNLLNSTRHRDPHGEDIDTERGWNRKQKAQLAVRIKEVLEDREHIPNKEEARGRRRERARRRND